MSKYLFALFSFFLPMAVFSADGSGALSFKPPPGDLSVIFLGNIFGVVDGVLHGTGSQIMGSIFTVFNSAVLALGGIIIMYTLLVSTMNTAHEGQFLGQKWSSIWIPMRTTIGLTLLIPKASGYCLMQIFVMWVIVQGVGAADKVWDAALGYLNRGGAIIQAQQNPGTALLSEAGQEIANGAFTILTGQVCMIGLEKALENQRTADLKQKQNQSGPCYGSISSEMEKFCNNPVPSLINSVNVLSARRDGSTLQSVTMPNLDNTSPYSALNGICGTIKWKSKTFDEGQVKEVYTLAQDTTALELIKQSRAIAIQQMYTDLSQVAHTMVTNDPALLDSDQSHIQPFSTVAIQQYGVPKTADGVICDVSATGCTGWGGVDASGSVLFNGTELIGAVMDYNAVMLPTLNLLDQVENVKRANQERAFISNATTQGWIMAGSYFFYLSSLNAAAKAPQLTDTDTGLKASRYDINALTSGFGNQGDCAAGSPYALLCTWMNQSKDDLLPIQYLIQGGGENYQGATAPQAIGTMPDLTSHMQMQNSGGAKYTSSTVFGFGTNSMILSLPGQPGQQSLDFANYMNNQFPLPPSIPDLPYINFGCGNLQVLLFSMCLGGMFGDLLYNVILRTLLNAMIELVVPLLNKIINVVFIIPLEGLGRIFDSMMKMISAPDVNPIVVLAQMGTHYINFAIDFMESVLILNLAAAFVPFGVIVMMIIQVFALPLVFAWIGVMASIGFVTAYYLPLLPYMIFTFGSIAWLIAVIEAMVAAPIVALGVTHPEGHEAFGKGEAAVMILMNVFLRPSMMIIGYISAISLSYVGVWILNAGYDNAIGFIQGGSFFGTGPGGGDQGSAAVSGSYTGWAGIYAYFFSILMYTTIYMTIVQKSFTLITYLPDKVLRWIGGSPESLGSDAAQWTEESKGKIGEAAKETDKAQQAGMKKLEAGASKLASGAGGGKGEASAQGGDDEPPPSSSPPSSSPPPVPPV